MSVIVHADMRPENLLLIDGNPRIADFGSARPLPGGSARENPNRIQRIAIDLQIAGTAAMAGAATDGRTGAILAGGVAYAWSRYRYPEKS